MKQILLVISLFASALVSAQVPTYVPTNGLVGWWGFSNNVLDASGNSNHGVIHGATFAADRSGNPNQAMNFVFDTVSIPNTNAFSLTQFSVTGWLNTVNQNGDYCTLFSHYGGTTIWSGYWVGMLQNRACIYVADNNGGFNIVGTTLINDGIWHHIAATYDGTTAKIYVDGLLENSLAVTMSFVSCQTSIGNDHLSEYFDGKLDDIGVWNRVLSATEVASLIQSNSPACINIRPVGSASNAYTNINRATAPITVNKDLNTVVFVHRNNIATFGGNSGSFRYDVSQDGGNTWSSEIGPINPQLTWPGRYPQASIYNPVGNTNPQNAYLAYLGATFDGTYWNGTVSGSRKLDGSTNTEFYNQPGVTGTLIPYSMTEGAPGVYWATEFVSDGFNNISGQHRLYKGVWNGSDVVWSENAVFSPTYDFTYYGTSEASVAFAPGGQIGWVCFIADLDVNNINDPQCYPILYKTTDGGMSWSGPIEVPLDPFPGVSCVSSTFAYPVATEYSLTVDINGNPHILTTVASAINGGYAVYDVTTNGALWFANYLSPINTAPSDPLVDNNNWHTWPQVTRSSDGTKIFYTWIDNQGVPAGSPNNSPDLYGRGLDVVSNTFTAVKNFTSCNPTCAGQIIFPQVADRVLEPTVNSYKIAGVYAVLSNMDPLQPTAFSFLDSLTFVSADFNVPYVSPSTVTNAVGTVSDTSICLGDSVYLSGTASNATTIIWRDPSGNTYSNNSWIHPNAAISVTMLASDNQGCPANGGTFSISVVDVSALAPSGDSLVPASCAISHDGSVVLLSPGNVINGTEPFISEYYIGTGNNYAIEIYNPTPNAIDLGSFNCSQPAPCSARLSSTSGTFNFPVNTILAPYSTIVIANPNAGPALLAMADYTSIVVNGSSVTMDILVPQFNIWLVVDVANVAAGQTTRRNSSVTGPNATLTTSEWSNYPLSINGLGNHGAGVVYNTPGVLIQWDINAGSQTGPIANNLQPGTYTYTISYPSATCFYQGSVTVPSLGLDQFGVNFAATQVLFTSPLFVAQFNNTTPNASAYNFIWDFGDGNFMNSNNPSVFHQYMYNGLYTVSLIAEDIASGCRDTLVRAGYIFCTGGNSCNVVANVQPPSSTTYCAGDTTFLTCNTNASYTYQWYNNGLPIAGATSPVLLVTQSGIYQVYISDANCTQISNQVLMMFYPAPAAPTITGNGNINSCTGGTVTLLATTGYQSYVWSNGANTNPISVSSSGNYTVTGYDQNGCGATSIPFSVNISAAQPTPVCYATVDSTSNYTVIIWNRPVSNSIDSFRVYRETMTNVYTHIGSVDFDSLTMYNDYAANPNVTSYRYKISALDTCGNETFLSEYHSTIHLQLLGMGNMQWTLYDIENQANPVLYYVVLRDDNSTGNFQPISSTIPGSNSTFTDINWSTYPIASYRVEVIWSIACSPSRTNGNQIAQVASSSMSNIKNAQTPLNSSETASDKTMSVFPNPTTNTLNVSWSRVDVSTLTLRDATGRTVRTYDVSGTQAQLSLEGLASGVYFLSVGNEAQSVQKIIKE